MSISEMEFISRGTGCVDSVEKDFLGNYSSNGFDYCGTTKISGTDGSSIWHFGGDQVI